jgi:hypothetical protein
MTELEQPRWQVPRKVPAGKLAVAAILLALAAVAAEEPWLWAVTVAVVAGLLAWAARDLAAPVRLAADAAGVTVVTGFARRRRLSWSQVERVRLDVRRRSRMLEIDTGEQLYLLSRYELDADLAEVAGELEALRTAAR